MPSNLGAGHGQTVGNADESFITRGRISYLHRAWDRGPHTAALETQPFGLVIFSMFGSGAYGPWGALGKKKNPPGSRGLGLTVGGQGLRERGFPFGQCVPPLRGALGVFRCPTLPYMGSWVSVATVPSVAVGRLHRCLDLRSPRFPQRIVLGHRLLEQSRCLKENSINKILLKF